MAVAEGLKEKAWVDLVESTSSDVKDWEDIDKAFDLGFLVKSL